MSSDCKCKVSVLQCVVHATAADVYPITWCQVDSIVVSCMTTLYSVCVRNFYPEAWDMLAAPDVQECSSCARLL